LTTYKYKGLSPDGAKLSGVIKAYNEFEAVAQLRETCSVITKIEEVKETQSWNKQIGTKKIKDKELAIICSQFAIILTSGLPIVRCVEMVAAQARTKELQKMLKKVAEDVSGGYSLAQSFENNATGFPTTFIETVRAGEQSGTLEECFEKLHKYYDKTAKMKAKIISTLTYPAIVICVAVIVFIIIMVVAVPAFTSVFLELGTELPGITKAVVAMSDFVTGYWYIVIAVIAAIVIAIKLYKQTDSGQMFFGNLARKLPVFGKLNIKTAASNYARTLSTLVYSGLPMIEALGITADTMKNALYKKALKNAREEVSKGVPLSEPITACGLFPPMVSHMTRIGEETGDLEGMLTRLADYYDEEVELATQTVMAAIEPMIILVLALIVGVLVAAVMAPMLTMYQAMDSL